MANVFAKITDGLSRSRDKFKESMNVLLNRGPDLDEGFWEELEDALVLSDVGGPASFKIVEDLREQATRQALPDAYAVLDLLSEQIENAFAKGGEDILDGESAVVLFVGINGTGKTTTVGKIAFEAKEKGRKVILGSADTFRAAAIEQLQIWADRADVEMVMRERGSDPASVCYDTIERAESTGCDLVLIDTAGRLHTSDDLMRELEKVVKVVRKRSNVAVYTVLVIDATTGQNGMQQAREFNKALDLDALIVTKLDGTAKGGIALAISHELNLPIIKIGVGEGIEDLRDFSAHDYVAALIGDFEEDDLHDYEPTEELSSNELIHDNNPSPVLIEPPVASEVVSVSQSSEYMSTENEDCFDQGEHKVAEVSGIDNEGFKENNSDLDSEAFELSISNENDTAQSKKMTWDEFVAEDDKLKSTRKKKHFWEKWR